MSLDLCELKVVLKNDDVNMYIWNLLCKDKKHANTVCHSSHGSRKISVNFTATDTVIAVKRNYAGIIIKWCFVYSYSPLCLQPWTFSWNTGALSGSALLSVTRFKHIHTRFHIKDCNPSMRSLLSWVKRQSSKQDSSNTNLIYLNLLQTVTFEQ